MTTEEFSALPLEARRFIEENAGCLACGGKERKLTEAYNFYLISKKMSAYQIIGGGVNFVNDGQKGVLYPIREEDTPEQIRDKIRIAGLIYATNPELFLIFDETEIEKLLASLEPAKVIDITKSANAGKTPLTDEEKAKAAADKKAKADAAKAATAEANAKLKAKADAEALAKEEADAAKLM